MPTFERCDTAVDHLAAELIDKYESHKPLKVADVKIDFVFAKADLDEDGHATNYALTKNGIRALGIARKIALKDRALGRGDAEIALDGDHWGSVSEEEQAALLDHELHHIAVDMDKHGNIKFDDLGRPQIKLRKHDYEIGHFHVIAQRHGKASIEVQQAKWLMDNHGQTYFPDIAPPSNASVVNRLTSSSVGSLTKSTEQRA